MARVCVAVMILILGAYGAEAAGDDCGPLRNYGIAQNELYYQPFGSDQFKPVTEKIAPPDTKSNLNFLFVLFPHDRRSRIKSPTGPTAISVKTQRYNDTAPYTDRVLLFRNAFPAKREYDNSVDRSTYTDYHAFDQPDFKLTRFHARYGTNSSVWTNRPEDKREAFKFGKPINWQFEDLRQSQLHYVNAVNPGGSCIPFFVGIGRDVKRLVISITDLDPQPGGDFGPIVREFKFEN